jgi:hypothetical protein
MCSVTGDWEHVMIGFGRNNDESISLVIPGGGIIFADDEKENGEFNEFVGVVFATVEVLEVDTEGDFAVGVCKYTDDAANLLAYCRSNRDREGDGTGTCTCIDEKGDD